MSSKSRSDGGPHVPRMAPPRCRRQPGSGTRTLGAGPHRNRGCGLVRSARIEALRGRPEQYQWAPLGPYDAGNWSCVRLVLTPRDTGAIADRRPSSAPLAPATAASALSRRHSTAEGRGTRRESADVSGTLVFDERADTQESDPAVDRVVLVLVGASVRHAGHAGGRLGHADRRASSSSKATRPTAAPARTGPTSTPGTATLRRRPASSAIPPVGGSPRGPRTPLP